MMVAAMNKGMSCFLFPRFLSGDTNLFNVLGRRALGGGGGGWFYPALGI